ncbi:DNA (cytosine-5-)-methyltransferase (plasmid) [Spirosoma taeanense]|uniref:Cytosine-specific methyltransferase n=2 Tax=Spirosoma taeanense TaxID=2735870 RepID=A0A6M5YFW7_9BACT|nr:DNA (cytosine-5-)-methyltransferase [Spirosoma taeanense]
MAYLTHYLHTRSNGASQYYEEEATGFVKQLIGADAANNPSEVKGILDVLEREVMDVPFPTPKTAKFKFIDLFAGIGGLRLAYQNLGGKCVFTSEWHPASQQTYAANFGEVPFGDITKISETAIPDHDVLLAGFPCQPFSIAGVSKKASLGREHGFKDETQGTLFFDVARIIEHKRPKAFMLENVKNLVSHDKKNTFRIIRETLNELRYNIHFRVLDGKHFVPQHRERIIIVGFDRDRYDDQEPFEFPELPAPTAAIEDILERDVPAKYTLTDNLWKYLQDYAAKHKAAGNGFGFGLTPLDGIARTLSARYHKDGSEILIPQALGQNPRRLTPRECARLQGFPDSFVIPVSDTQAYRQFGNSVVMPLMQAVGQQVVRCL